MRSPSDPCSTARSGHLHSHIPVAVLARGSAGDCRSACAAPNISALTAVNSAERGGHGQRRAGCTSVRPSPLGKSRQVPHRKISPGLRKTRARQVSSDGERWFGRQCLFWAGLLPDENADILSELQATIILHAIRAAGHVWGQLSEDDGIDGGWDYRTDRGRVEKGVEGQGEAFRQKASQDIRAANKKSRSILRSACGMN